MKRVFAIILTFAIVFCLCACGDSAAGGNQTGAAAGLQVGYGRESIMPEGSIGVGGYANSESRLSTGFKDILYTTCLALSEGEDTVLMFSVDTIYMDAPNTKIIRQKITEKTGIPGDKIMLCGTHTHSGPAYHWEPYFSEIFVPAFVAAAEAALADKAPATMYGGKTEADINYVRHYITTEGQYIDNGTASKNPLGLEKHAREADPEMTVIKIDRGAEKKAISLINWQCHPCFAMESDTYLSADFIASLRTDVETQTGMQCIYFTGASGDLGSGTKMPNEKAIHDPAEFGSTLAKTAIDAYNGTMTKIEGTGIKTIQEQFEYNTNKDGVERLEDAKKVKEYAEQMGSHENPQVTEYANSLGFDSSRQAATIVTNAERPDKRSFEINALSIGGLAFITAPYEMFSTNGQFIKENSPFEFTVITTVANGYENYFAVKEAYDVGNTIYEVNTAGFASGVAEATAERFVELLKTLQ